LQVQVLPGAPRLLLGVLRVLGNPSPFTECPLYTGCTLLGPFEVS